MFPVEIICFPPLSLFLFVVVMRECCLDFFVSMFVIYKSMFLISRLDLCSVLADFCQTHTVVSKSSFTSLLSARMPVLVSVRLRFWAAVVVVQSRLVPCLVPGLKGSGLNFSPCVVMLAMGLSYIAFFILSHVPSKLNLLRFFFS